MVLLRFLRLAQAVCLPCFFVLGCNHMVVLIYVYYWTPAKKCGNVLPVPYKAVFVRNPRDFPSPPTTPPRVPCLGCKRATWHGPCTRVEAMPLWVYKHGSHSSCIKRRCEAHATQLSLDRLPCQRRLYVPNNGHSHTLHRPRGRGATSERYLWQPASIYGPCVDIGGGRVFFRVHCLSSVQ